MEYTQDQRWGDLKTKRSNRFYLNHDIDNADFLIMERFHEKMEEFKPNIVGISGF
jgi:hypothetical protein